MKFCKTIQKIFLPIIHNKKLERPYLFFSYKDNIKNNSSHPIIRYEMFFGEIPTIKYLNKILINLYKNKNETL